MSRKPHKPLLNSSAIFLLFLFLHLPMAGCAYDDGHFSTKAGKAWRNAEPLQEGSDYLYDPKTGFAIKHDPLAGR